MGRTDASLSLSMTGKGDIALLARLGSLAPHFQIPFPMGRLPSFPLPQMKKESIMKNIPLFQRHAAPGQPAWKTALFWGWNLFWGLCAALGVGLVSLVFAAVIDQKAMLLSYFQNPLIAFLNLAPVVALYFLLYFVLGRAALAYGLTAALTLGFTMGSWFKLQFRNDPLLFEDLLLLKEAGNMAGKYQLFLTKTMVLALVLVLAGLLFLSFCVRGRPGPRLRLLGFSLAVLCALPLWDMTQSDNIYNNRTVNNDLINQWSATQVYVSKGFVYPFLHSVKAASDAPPEGYDAARAETILSAYDDAPIPEDKQVSVISVMLESYDDFTKYGTPTLDPKVYADYHALEAESITGDLITNIFAGGTVDSERCFLTGFADLGSFRAPTNSYPWYFRSQGYTVTGAHPCYAWFYNRENINVNLGFQDYRFVENHFAPMTGGDVGYDDLFFPELIQLWERDKALGKPVFQYNLSYQGHGPYNTDKTWWGDDYVVDDRGYSEAERNILNNYFGSIYNTNQNLTAFFDYFREEEEPVVIVLFGDHNPWLGDGNSVYEAIGLDLDFSTPEGFYNYYSTRYLIWANDAAKAVLGRDFVGEGPTVSPNFLMNVVFDACGWEGPAYMQAVQPTMEQVPVMNTPTGLYMEDGAVTGALTPEGQALTEDYDMLQYYYRKHFLYNGLS